MAAANEEEDVVEIELDEHSDSKRGSARRRPAPQMRAVFARPPEDEPEDSPRRIAMRLSPRKGGDRQPLVAPGRGRPVEVAYQIIRIDAVSTESHTFFADFRVFYRWWDPELVGADPESVDWSSAWLPNVYVANAVQLEEAQSTLRLRDPGHGRVHHTVRYQGTLHENDVRMEAFPFDRQGLGVVISTRHSVSRVVLVPHGRRENTVVRFGLPEWQVSHHFAAVADTDPARSAVNAAYSEFRGVVVLRRRAAFFLLNAMLFLFALTSAAYTAAAMPPDELSPRMQVLVGLLFTSVALRVSIAAHLPRVSYMTVLDVYQAVCAAFLFAMVGVSFAMAQLHKDGGRTDAELRDEDNRWTTVWLLCWAVANVVFGVFAYLRSGTCRYRPRHEEPFGEIPAVGVRREDIALDGLAAGSSGGVGSGRVR